MEKKKNNKYGKKSVKIASIILIIIGGIGLLGRLIYGNNISISIWNFIFIGLGIYFLIKYNKSIK